ncbi:MAG: hypothetical protein U9N14_03500, partial [Pseudomonadota bacterium]|nr:hypothetical protein [Pseudomonadota bacterium]
MTFLKGIEIAEPLPEIKAGPGGPEDGYQVAVLDALKKSRSDNTNVTADVDILDKIRKEAPDIHWRYMATSPAWRVYAEEGAVYAQRRWMIGDQWHYLHWGEAYERDNLCIWSDDILPDFGTSLRMTIKPKSDSSKSDADHLRPGKTQALNIKHFVYLWESVCLINLWDMTVRIFEGSDFKERRITKAALAYINRELSPLVDNPCWDGIKEALPEGGIR